MSYVESGWGFLNDPPSGGNGGGNGGAPAPSIDYGYDEPEVFIGEGWGGNPPDDPPAPTFTPAPSIDYGYAYDDDVSGVDFWNPSSESSTNNQQDTRFGGNLELANTSVLPTHGVNQFFPTDENVGLGGPYPVLENLGSSNLEKNMSMYDPSGLVYNFLNMLANAAPNSKYDPFVKTRQGKVVYQNAQMGEPGAVLVNGQWKKPTLNKLGKFLHDQGTTGTYDDEGRFTMENNFPTTSSEMFTGVPTTLLPQNIPAITGQLDKVLNYLGRRGGSSGGPGPHYGGWGYGGGRGGSGGGGGGGTPKYGGDFAGEGLWGLSHIQRKWIEQLRNPHGGGYFRGMNRGGIVSLC